MIKIYLFSITILTIVFLIFVGPAVVSGFMDGMSSNANDKPSEIFSINFSSKHYEIIVDSHGDYEYSKSSNENIW